MITIWKSARVDSMEHFKHRYNEIFLKYRYYLMITNLLLFSINITNCNYNRYSENKSETEIIISNTSYWGDAAKNKDIKSIMSLFSENAVIVIPEAPAIFGSKEIKKWIENMFIDTTYLFETYTGTIDDIQISESSDLAYVRGVDIISHSTDSDTIKESGNFIDIWKKEKGKWKCILTFGDMKMKYKYLIKK
jgi:ketosteroid isomerase-like protein